MPASSLESVVRHLRRLHAPASDGELLSRFADGRDADAFAELARRHGPMVLGVCRRILGDAHAAEDAFQTTFLTLARYARSLRRPAALAAWLHGVAVRTAQRARARRQRCQHTETHRLPPSQPPDPLAEVSGRELVAAIDEELARLPECYRAPLLLCGLDGLTRDDTAARLGWSLGTLRGRLERGRELLRKRLTARGLTVPTVLAGLVTADRATVPAGLLAATVRLALTASPATWGPAAALALAGVLFAAVGVGAIIAPASRERERPEFDPQTPVAHAPGSPQNSQPVAAAGPRVDVLGDPLPDGAVARLGSQRLRPGQIVSALAFSPDGRRLVSWSEVFGRGGRLHIWDAADGRQLRRTEEIRAQMVALRWLADGRGVALLRFGPDDYFVWDFADEKAPLPPALPGAQLNSHKAGEIVAAAISPDGRWLATGRSARADEARPIEVWELAVNKPLGELKSRVLGEQPGQGYKLAFSADSRTLFALSRTQEPNRAGAFVPGAPIPVVPGKLADQARLVVRDLATGQEKAAFDLPAAGGGVSIVPGQTNVVVSPDGQTLIVGQQDGTVRLWDWQAGNERRAIVAHPPGDRKLYEFGGVGALAISGDGKTLFTGGSIGPRRLWDLATGQAIGPGEGRNQFHAVAVAPDGKRLAAGGSDGQTVILDFATGTNLVPGPGHRGWVERVFVRPDGRTALTVGLDGAACRWDLATGRELGRISLDVPAWFWPIAFTSDGRGLIGQSTASVEIANETYLWDTDTGKRQPLTETFATTKGSILTPPVGGAVLFREQDVRTVTLREWPTGRLRHTFALPSPQPPADEHVALSAALSPDGRRAAVAGRDNRKAGDATYYGSGYVSLFDTTAGRLIRGWSTPHAYFDRVVFTPDGGALIGGGYTVQPFDPAGGPRGVGQYKAEQALQLFDIEAGQAVRSYLPPGVDATAHRRIAALAVSPDGRQVAAAESDYSIWVYELATGQARRHFVGHSNEVTALAFTPDGQRLISTSRDLTALVWDVSQAGAE